MYEIVGRTEKNRKDRKDGEEGEEEMNKKTSSISRR